MPNCRIMITEANRKAVALGTSLSEGFSRRHGRGTGGQSWISKLGVMTQMLTDFSFSTRRLLRELFHPSSEPYFSAMTWPIQKRKRMKCQKLPLLSKLSELGCCFTPEISFRRCAPYQEKPRPGPYRKVDRVRWNDSLLIMNPRGAL